MSNPSPTVLDDIHKHLTQLYISGVNFKGLFVSPAIGGMFGQCGFSWATAFGDVEVRCDPMLKPNDWYFRTIDRIYGRHFMQKEEPSLPTDDEVGNDA